MMSYRRMIQSNGFVAFQAAVDALATLCRDRQTGVLYLETPDREMAHIDLVEGRISNVSYLSNISRAAIALLPSIREAQYRFSARSVYPSPVRTGLPDNTEILHLLGWNQPSELTVLGPISGKSDELTPETCARLQALLTEYMGPVATFACQSACNRATSVSEAIAILATELPDPHDARAFQTAATGLVPASAKTDELTPEARTVLQVLLTDYMGPVAIFVCQSTFDRAHSVSEAIAILAAELPDPNDARAFQIAAEEQLQDYSRGQL